MPTRSTRRGRGFTYGLFVRATPERVWQAFTDPDDLNRWETVRAEIDLRPGGAFRWEFEYGARDDGTFLEVDPPRRLVQHWASQITPAIRLDLVSVLTLAQADQGTELTLRMRGYGASDDQEWLRQTMIDGWTRDLIVLKVHLETGQDARPWIWAGLDLGARCITLPRRRAPRAGVRAGAYVLDVAPGSLAAAAGVRRGDVIVAFGGFPVRERRDLLDAVERHRDGQTVVLEFVQDGRRRFGEITLRSVNPFHPAAASAAPS